MIFVNYSKTKSEFISEGLASTYNNDIVFIRGSGCIYTHGTYFSDLEELLSTTNYLKGVKIGDDLYNSAQGGGYLSFIDNEQVKFKVDSNGIQIELQNSNKTVNWSILEDTHKGHEYVNLGLPSGTLWASCNVGAEAPEEYGDYFAWGETSTKSDYASSTSVTYGLSVSELESRGIIGSDGNLTAAYDVAAAKWGGSWRMPTSTEMKELIDSCTWKWTTQNGVNGYEVTGPNDNSIFLPSAGYRSYTQLNNTDSYGYYWSATPDFYNGNAHGLSFYSSRYYYMYNYRDYGYTVRPVLTKTN